MDSNIAEEMSQIKYYAPGAPGGGEHGRRRSVLSSALDLRSNELKSAKFEWIDDASARKRLEELPLTSRDRFLIDLLYNTGIRVGEALSLFISDMHFGGGGPDIGCRIVDPHFHVRLDNPVQNRARAKGLARNLFVSRPLVDRYIDYMISREETLGENDSSPHVFVNMRDLSGYAGTAMNYSGVRKLIARCAKLIDFPLTGPHMLRHTFATRLVRGIGVDEVSLDIVQAILGHRHIDSTRIYTHDNENAMRKALVQLQTRHIVLGGSE
ncbi:tyrosine-type recombinase/integrase [Brevibacterium aurantiacum]|nr:tyrosine-type recombinase/integrase [Brevibacterium aurantiacum]